MGIITGTVTLGPDITLRQAHALIVADAKKGASLRRVMATKPVEYQLRRGEPGEARWNAHWSLAVLAGVDERPDTEPDPEPDPHPDTRPDPEMCRNGLHRMTADNIYAARSGTGRTYRCCRTCRRIGSERQKARRKQRRAAEEAAA